MMFKTEVTSKIVFRKLFGSLDAFKMICDTSTGDTFPLFTCTVESRYDDAATESATFTRIVKLKFKKDNPAGNVDTS